MSTWLSSQAALLRRVFSVMVHRLSSLRLQMAIATRTEEDIIARIKIKITLLQSLVKHSLPATPPHPLCLHFCVHTSHYEGGIASFFALEKSRITPDNQSLHNNRYHIHAHCNPIMEATRTASYTKYHANYTCKCAKPLLAGGNFFPVTISITRTAFQEGQQGLCLTTTQHTSL